MAAPPCQDDITRDLRASLPAPLAEKLDATAAGIGDAHRGERRDVTVLLFDVVDLTAATRALDSEESYLWADEIMRPLAEVVHKYEGVVDKYTGDGLTALFGVPVAHENDPERAVRAALEIIAALRPLKERFEQAFGSVFHARIGINTGPVLVGQAGDDLHINYTVIGDTIGLADHLRSAAEPDSIAVSFAAYQRTQSLFQYRTLPPLSVDGKPQSIRVFRPLGLRAKPGRARGLPRLHVPMVGRRQALTQLRDTLAEVRQRNRSQFLSITGEAGVGKSRLVAELRGSVDLSSVNFFQGSCLSYARSKPLWLLASLLRDILQLSEIDPAEVQRKVLQAHLDRLELANDDILPYVANVLGLEQTDPELEARLDRFDSAVLQKFTHAALRQLLLAETNRAPTILVFEDLHWVDPASRDFLNHLVQTAGDVPLMVIMVSRASGRETTIKPLAVAAEQLGNPLVDIRLSPLSIAEGQLLVDQLLKPAVGEIQSLKRRIVERAEGNPLYAEEIVRVLIDQGGLVSVDDGLRVTAEAQALVEQVPGTLNGLILARFDQLPEDLRRTLQQAAVLEGSFPVDLIEGFEGARSEDVTVHLSALVAHQFLSLSSFGGGTGFAFRHALIQEAIYGTLLRRDRQRLHEQAAKAIERSAFFWPLDQRTEALAHHYAESTDPLKAVPYLITAAGNADRRCAPEIAIQHYRRALSLMKGSFAVDSDQYLRAWIGLGRALKFAGEYAEASQTLEEGLQHLLGQSVRDESVSLLPNLVDGLIELADIRAREGASEAAVTHLEAGLDALGEEGAQVYLRLWFSLLERLAWVRFRQGKLEDAFALASSAALRVGALERDDPIKVASLYNTLGGIFWQWGNLPQAADYVERSLDLYQGLGYAWGAANAYTNLGILSYVRGKWTEALDCFIRSDGIRREIGYIPSLAHNLKNLGLLRMAMGDHKRARKDLEDSLTISQRLGDDFGVALAHLGLGHLAVIQSRFEEAAAHIEAALRLSDVVGEDQLIEARWLSALIRAEGGDLQAGLESAEQALQMAREVGLMEAEADCRRVLGLLRARAGQYVEAEALLRESVDLCLQVNAPYSRSLALLELGGLYQHLIQTGGSTGGEWRAEALAVLGEAVQEFKRLGAAYDLQRARTILDELQGGEMAEIVPPRSEEKLPEGEWHTAAILWLGIGTQPGVDEEAVFETLALVMPRFAVIAREHHGQAIRRRDGLTVVFGAPTAYEDDAERAVQTAWRMLQDAAELDRQSELPVTFRVAVSQGRVIAGHTSSRLHAELVVRGDPVEAAQLAAESAPPGEVWVTEAVYTATARLFDYEPAPPDVRVRLGDLPLWMLAGRRAKPLPVRGLWGLKARFIGREKPLQEMVALSKSLGDGLGGVIWIEGEPGIGKSRLMIEFSESMQAKGVRVWSGRCSAQRSSHAFSLFSDLLRQALNMQAMEAPDQIRGRIDRAFQEWPADVQVTRPYLDVLLGMEPSGLDEERIARLTPEQLRQQAFVALRRLFKSLADKEPLVILLDDLHWIDPVSAELLQFLVKIVTTAPILFVCAQRRQGADSPNDRLLRAQGLIPTQTVRFCLERLSAAESEMLLNELLPQAVLPPDLRAAIVKQSEGNPYFIEEFVRMLIEKGYLEQRQGRWRADPSREVGDLPLPSSLETLIRSRIDALPQELRQLLQCASVIGPSFETVLLEASCEMSSVRATIRRLESRLLVRRGAEADRWDFNHTLIQSVSYNSILKARRRVLHLRVAQALEARWAGVEADHADELAYHFSKADEDEKALTYLVMAAERAAARYANEEAITYFEEATQRLSAQPEASIDLRWRVATGLGDAYRSVGRYADSVAALEMSLPLVETGGLSDELQASLYRRLGDATQRQGELEVAHRHLVEALEILGDPDDLLGQAEAARVLTRLAWVYFSQGHFEQARQMCEDGVAAARRADSLSELASAENILGGIYYRQSDWTSALHHTMRAMVLREQAGYTWGVAGSLSNMGVLAVSAGHWEKAWSFFDRSLALRREMGDAEGVAIVHNNLGTLARFRGELDLAEAHFRESLAIAKPFEIGFHIVNSTIGLAQVMLAKGQIVTAQRTIADSLTQAEEIGAEDLLAESHWVQAEILLAGSALDEAKAEVDRAVLMAAETGNRNLEASAWRVASEIELAREEPQAAREALDKARQAMADATDQLEAGHIAAQAGRINLHEGQLKQAEADLEKAQEIYMRLGAKGDLERVQETLKEALALRT